MKKIKIYQDNGNVLKVFDEDEDTDYNELCKSIMNSKTIVQLTTPYSSVTLRPSRIVSIMVEDAKDEEVKKEGNGSIDLQQEDYITDGEE